MHRTLHNHVQKALYLIADTAAALGDDPVATDHEAASLAIDHTSAGAPMSRSRLVVLVGTEGKRVRALGGTRLPSTSGLLFRPWFANALKTTIPTTASSGEMGNPQAS